MLGLVISLKIPILYPRILILSMSHQNPKVLSPNYNVVSI